MSQKQLEDESEMADKGKEEEILTFFIGFLNDFFESLNCNPNSIAA